MKENKCSGSPTSTAVTIENPCKALMPSRYFLLQHQHDNRLSLEHFWKMGLNAQKSPIWRKIKCCAVCGYKIKPVKHSKLVDTSLQGSKGFMCFECFILITYYCFLLFFLFSFVFVNRLCEAHKVERLIVDHHERDEHGIHGKHGKK